MNGEIYVSTDVEADGPIPGPHSMLSFASAAYRADKTLVSTFTANLETLPGAKPHPATMDWWNQRRDAYEATRRNTLDPAEATRRIARLAPYDLTWIEEPVPQENLSGHAKVRATSPIPIQAGENWWFPRGFAEAIAAGASDFIMPDLMKVGGITGWLNVVGQADAASIPMSSHILPEASAHVLAVTPTAHWLEVLDFAGAILAEPLQIKNGALTARGPGLGLEWNEAAVAKYLI